MREGPDHYTRLKPEPTDVIVAWDLPWRIANVVKYCARYRFKNGVEDLKKARHYLDMEIEAMEEQPPWFAEIGHPPPMPCPPPGLNDWLKPTDIKVLRKRPRLKPRTA